MSVSAALREAADRLEPVSDTARLDAELLMAHALGVSRSQMLLNHMRESVPIGFAPLLERRLRSEPVAYILGEQEFFGRSFIVTPEVLIPRGDSECVVEAALDRLRPCLAETKRRILDCGTGSGALLLTLLAQRPDASGVGIDRSLGALSVAAANAARLGLSDRARMLRRDWREPYWAEGLGAFDLVIANPPYVESDARLDIGVSQFEPSGALYAGPDGLDDYRILVPQLRNLLAGDGFAVIEIGAKQANSVGQLARDCGFEVTVFHDLAHRPRGLVLT